LSLCALAHLDFQERKFKRSDTHGPAEHAEAVVYVTAYSHSFYLMEGKRYISCFCNSNFAGNMLIGEVKNTPKVLLRDIIQRMHNCYCLHCRITGAHIYGGKPLECSHPKDGE